MKVNVTQWATPGLIYCRGKTRAVRVPAPLLCLNTPAWATCRMEALRIDASDTDYSKTERRNWTNRADMIQAWLDTQRGTIPFCTNEMLSIRTEAQPWVVMAQDLDNYVEKVLLRSATSFTDNADPTFLLWSDENRKTLHIANTSLSRIIHECPSPDVEVKRVTQEELYAEIGRMSAAQAALAMASKMKTSIELPN